MTGKIILISGPVVEAEGLPNVGMYEVCKVGHDELIGEVIRVYPDKVTIQVYEETSGLRPGEPVVPTGMTLSVELGPGILKSIYDGIQRPLKIIRDETGDFIKRGVVASPIDKTKKWQFTPTKKVGDYVVAGDIIGTVPETSIITHKILVPYGISGKIVKINEGEFTVVDEIAVVEDENGKKHSLTMLQRWPVRKQRPFKEKVPMDTPLITGQRVIDAFFPIAKGGTAAIPGGFGTGKTVTLHQYAKWADAQVVVYVGCGERGNEMTEALEEWPELDDPHTGKPLMERTILIANTSNMPVAAREASIYTGVTIAEYFRDMGYDVALMADSTSRWAEALREISGRLSEMPGEEGYPAYLASRLAEFYERGGRVKTLGSDERLGSVTINGAVSPPGGDLSEPVTQNTLRIVRVFWSLDKGLAARKFFPAINYLRSYSLYRDTLKKWTIENLGHDWPDLVKTAMAVLQKDQELREIVQLVGPDALPESDRVYLEAAKMIKEDFLMQSALDEIDTFCPIKKTYRMLKIIIKFYEAMKKAVEQGVSIKAIMNLPVVDNIAKMKIAPWDSYDKTMDYIENNIEPQFAKLISQLE